jgi:hypothetical protein
MLTPDLLQEPVTGIPLAVVFRRAVLFNNRFGRQRDDFTQVRVNNRRAQ